MEEKNFERGRGFMVAKYLFLLSMIFTLVICFYAVTHVGDAVDRCTSYWKNQMLEHHCIVPNTINDYQMDFNYSNSLDPDTNYYWKK